MAEYCCVCGKALCRDDIGFYKKLVNRGATDGFKCVECLSAYFGMTVERSHEMIEEFRKSGCTLFG